MKVILALIVFISLAVSKEKIDVNFNNLDLLQLIKITSQTINKNILVSHKINAKINFVSNEPIYKSELLYILKQALKDNGYVLKEYKEFYKVDKIEKKQTVKTKKVDKKAFVRETKVIKLINIEAKDLEKTLSKIVEKRESKNSLKTVVIYEESSNSIVLDGAKKDIESLSYIIKSLDKRKKQVYVKAKIVELDDFLLNDIGFKFGILGAKTYSSGLYTFSSSLNNGAALTFDTSSIGLEIPNLTSSLALGASLNLLNKTYALDIVSEPSILCVNNSESMIYVGETVSIQTGSITSDGENTKNVFEREDIGLTLKVKPRVDGNSVLLDIKAILEGVKNSNTNENPDTSKKQITTRAFVSNGESVILGGLIEKKSEKNIEKVPYASDIPLIGELFKNRYKNSRTKNLIVIITPYIVPKDKNITYVTNELAKLNALEDKLLENYLIKLKKKKEEKSKTKVKEQRYSAHEENLKKFFSHY